MDFETDNPEKEELLERSAQQRQHLEEEFRHIAERSEKILTNALVIGGALALTYFLVSGLSRSSSKRKRRKAEKVAPVASGSRDQPVELDEQSAGVGIVSQIGSVLAAQATGFLLSIAREKLVEFLQAQVIKKQQENGHS